jgi:hypothetical protein
MGYDGTQGNNHGWTCVAFARYAFFYVFGLPWDVPVFNYQTPTGTSIVPHEEARIGDVFVWNDRHMAMFLGNNGERDVFCHSNWIAPNRVSWQLHAYRDPPDYIIRADHYDEYPTAAAESGEVPPYSRGDVDGNGFIEIDDALEILKFVVGLESVIGDAPCKSRNAALIVSDTTEAAPSTADALEILKYVAGLESVIQSTQTATQTAPPTGEYESRPR